MTTRGERAAQLASVVWSEFRDWHAGGAKVREAVDRSPYREKFIRTAAKFAAKASRHESIHAGWWIAPFIVIEVHDSRLHYPCRARARVSFDLGNGKFASPGSRLYDAFARKGWGEFIGTLTRRSVPRYTECAEPARARGCPIPSHGAAGQPSCGRDA